MKRIIIISFAWMCLLNCSFAQFNTFIKNFQKCSLPFIATESTFDMYYAEDDRYVISENDFMKYLMMENDTFVNIKGTKVIGTHKYLAVCKFDVYDNFLGVLYYRTVNDENGNLIQELMLSVFTKKGKLISAYPISGFYITKRISFDATIFSAENIEISLYTLEPYEDRWGTWYTRSEDITYKKYLHITKEGLIQQTNKE